MQRADPTTESLEQSNPLLVRAFTVLVMDGPDAGRRVRVTTGRAVVGSHESAEVRVSDPAISRFHAELVAEHDRVRLRDLGSRNGVFVAGIKLHDATLPAGVVLEVGRTHLRVELEPTVHQHEASETTRFGNLVGHSTAMRRVFSLLERAASSAATVLLTGETGTGKEAAARSIHDASSRAKGPFVVVDCSSVPASLFEAELFGHDKGAFTGAHATREGAFELADGGTLFIDEIGELSLDLQPKLLRVLEQREVKRIGSQRTTPVDVRVIAATHRDLRAGVNARTFRADLYYRLAVVEITLPPLRDRPEDLGLLAESLGTSIAGRLHMSATPLASPALLDELRRHRWPGNVRELRNFLERYLVLGGFEVSETVSSDTSSRPADVVSRVDDRTTPVPLELEIPLKEGRERAIAAFERAYLTRTLENNAGNVTDTARAAQVDRVHLYRLLKKNGLRG